jgi:hypothetical protein
LVERHSVELDGTGVRLDKLGDHAHSGRLPGAVRAQEPYDLPAVHLEGDSVHGGNAAETFGDPLKRK